MRILVGLLLSFASLAAPAAAERIKAPPERAFAAFHDDPARRFDFWIGEWTVNLRIKQHDGTFQDAVAARPHIYENLDGKAILELWDSVPIDITPFSLRWDDLLSKDGGKSWAQNWIMEWNRVAVDPPWPLDDDAVPTFVDGGRCGDEAFRPYEAIVGHWEGDGVRLDAYRILDGCAVMAFLEAGERKEFLFLTFLSREQRWETGVLDQRPETGLVRYQSAEDWTRPSNAEGESVGWSVDGDRLSYRRGPAELRLTRSR